MKRMGAIFAAFVSLLWMSGCSTLPKNFVDSTSNLSSDTSDVASSAIDATPKTFTLSYNKSDTLNPFTAATRSNLELCSLLYEGLTMLDNTLTPQINLASSIDTSNPLALTAMLRSDARFSDGSSITASDVTASFNLAKASANYKALLSNVQSASLSGNGTIVFSLASRDPNSVACLSFPIIKSGTDSAPIGSGLYFFSGGDEPVLNGNPYHGTELTIDCIHLLNLPDGDALLYGLENGSISYYFSDLSDGKIPYTSSASVNVPLNYMMFLGTNASRTSLSDPVVRQALSAAIGRVEISANAFAGRATPAVSPFNPVWASATAITGFGVNENIAVAVAQLEQAGYNSTGGKSLSLELLVSEGNSFRDTAAALLTQQFAKVGVTLKVTPLPFDKYTERLSASDFDLYLGEIRLTADMSLRPWLTAGGSTSYGINTSGSAAQAYSQYLEGSLTVQQFTDTFVADLPFIPLCWREGLAAYNRSISNVTPTAFDAYYGITGWSYS